MVKEVIVGDKRCVSFEELLEVGRLLGVIKE